MKILKSKKTITFILVLLSIFVNFESNSGIKEEQKILFKEGQFLSEQITELYNSIKSETSKPDIKVFQKSIIGYLNMKSQNQLSDKNIISIIDFSLPSNKERLWIIDLEKREVLYHSLVAHGRNTGLEFPQKFSNKPESFMSSLGFFVTGEIYKGKHGISLSLDGVDEGFNTRARERSVVIHGANYVSSAFIKQTGRLGRSQGCPAIPEKIAKEVINTVKDKTCLFIYSKVSNYDRKSILLNKDNALSQFIMNNKSII